MTKDEALKLALEALEAVAIQGDIACVVTNDGEIYLKPAITAVKEALEKPETDWERVARIKEEMLRVSFEDNKRLKEALANDTSQERVDETAKQQHEPVACVEYIPCCTDQTCQKCKATTPPQRTWVGLTDEERDAMIDSTDLSGAYYYDDLYAVILAVEAKLKEKNT